MGNNKLLIWHCLQVERSARGVRAVSVGDERRARKRPGGLPELQEQVCLGSGALAALAPPRAQPQCSRATLQSALSRGRELINASEAPVAIKRWLWAVRILYNTSVVCYRILLYLRWRIVDYDGSASIFLDHF